MRLNPLYSGNPEINYFANSKDRDEMQHNGACHQVYTVCQLDKKDMQT